MAKIRILPEHLANQIAAGEVVERPASVVKELVENCLDAGATRIEVDIEGGGTRLIRVIDDGEGMDEDDLLLSLERHGTSKLSDQEGLDAIDTLGFRGEAIPSIGSVSKLTLTSRPKALELGTRVQLDYGKLTKVHETGCSTGTKIEVRNLFGNTPARKKFLRTHRTELGHIEEVLKNYALCSPEITFILRIDDKQSLYLDNSLSFEQRLARIMNYRGDFISLDNGDEASKRSLFGLLVPPDTVSSGPSKLRIFVNGRTVKDRMINHAVAEGMRGFLMKGKNPSGLVHLRLPPHEVDVNVHPAKQEVRFRSGQDLHAFIVHGVAEAFLHHQDKVKSSIFSPAKLPERTPVPLDRHSSEELESANAVPEEYAHRPVADSVQNTRRRATTSPNSNPGSSQPLFTTAEPISHLPRREVPAPGPGSSNGTVPKIGHDLLVIGQLDDLYLFCKNSEGLLVIDQHAAHERLLYEKFRKQYMNKEVARQTLMFPETLELSLLQVQLVEKYGQEIDRMGFSYREFGGNTYIISAVPALLARLNAADSFVNLLEQFGSEKSGDRKNSAVDSILSTMACRAAVKAGTALSHLEIDSLLSQMVKADVFSHCPHGRPVAKQFSKDEIKKWFHRT